MPARAPPGAAAPEAAPAAKPWLSADKVLFVLVCALLYCGWHFPTERYISPKRGIGYALGIVGGSLMLLLLVYSLRKRWGWLRFLGSTPSWFRFHMVLGVLGPLCILYHSNFSTGATNSNVALFCMLTVAGSGLIGRYIYAHIHHGLYGRKLELGELRESAENLHGQAGYQLSARAGGAPRRGRAAACCGPARACRCSGFFKPTDRSRCRACACAGGCRLRAARAARQRTQVTR